ncbi:MAG: hypothetical protein KAR20_10835, partial [Candidatus Heimdallarchaeota archaeon]|nr:hypothetical protein [Candidatus Heimdallarchaeota archaeon]
MSEMENQQMRIEDYNLESYDRMIPVSMTLEPSTLLKLETLRGRLNRSRYINQLLNKVLSQEEVRLGIKS